MRFWDSSAVVALLAAEPARERLTAVLAEDPSLLVWWATPVECASAVSRRERDGSLCPPAHVPLAQFTAR